MLNFIFAYGCSSVPSSFLEDFPFSIEFPFYLCQKSVDYIFVVLFLGSPFHSLYLCDYYFHNEMLCRLLQLYIKSQSSVSPAPLFLFLSIVLTILNSFSFHINFRISLSVSTEQLAEILIGIALDLQIRLKRINILTILSHVFHKHGLSPFILFFYFYQCFIAFLIYILYILIYICVRYKNTLKK